MALKNEEQRELLTVEENTYDMEGFTYTEIKMIRSLVQDRIENRFQYAAKAASEMNAKILDSTNTEIQRLIALKQKLMEETEHA